MPPNQPTYMPYPAVYPREPVTPFRPPVTKSLTIKMMLLISGIMLFCTLGLLALGLAITAIHESYTYSKLKPYDATHIHISIPQGWEMNHTTHQVDSVHYEFSDNSAFSNDDQTAHLQVYISNQAFLNDSGEVNPLMQTQARSQMILDQRLQVVIKSLNCQAGTKTSNTSRISALNRATNMYSLDCTTSDVTYHIVGRYVVDLENNLTTELLYTSQHIWQEHGGLLTQSLNSVKVTP